LGIVDLRALVTAIAIGLVPSAAAPSGLPSGASGLICTASSGARLMLNIDPKAMRFQKEGFAVLPILAADADSLVLSRFANDEIVILSSIGRRTLVYTAQSKEKAPGAVSRTDYQCVVGPPIDFASR
jgi:hypothetical protein